MADTLTVVSPKGGTSGSVQLPAALFDQQTNVPLIHQVVTAQLAAARQGTHKTKGRGEVSGSGVKPFKQKGTGRSRQGSVRAPEHRGGGIVHQVAAHHAARIGDAEHDRPRPRRCGLGDGQAGQAQGERAIVMAELAHAIVAAELGEPARGLDAGEIGAVTEIEEIGCGYHHTQRYRRSPPTRA